MPNPTMNTQDAVSANFAECFVTLDGTRYSMLMAKEFEGKASVNTKEVYKLGCVVVGHKAQTIALAFSIDVYKRQLLGPAHEKHGGRLAGPVLFLCGKPGCSIPGR